MLTRAEPPLQDRARARRFRGWSSLVTRILFVNLVALFVLAGGILYLDSFRARLLESREQELLRQGEIVAVFLADRDLLTASAAVPGLSSPRGTRIRVIDREGTLIADNWSAPAVQRFSLEDPTTEGFRRQSAIFIDRIIDALTLQDEVPLVADKDLMNRSDWPEVRRAAQAGVATSQARQTESRLVVLQAAVPIADGGTEPFPVVLLTIDTPDVIDMVRRERATSFAIFLAMLGFSAALSLYLGRTIVMPLRQLALAAHRVRLGRARDVVVPRLPHRRDEIGGLARALADMTVALRQRIDATEAFAADVAHELKNPLASLRSAVEALGTVRDPQARQQLFALIEADVGRIDRLISDISAASRLEAELSRARLQPVDLAQLATDTVQAINATGRLADGVRLQITTADHAVGKVAADHDRLTQVITNLIDNAVSFAPSGSVVQVAVASSRDIVELVVEDEGPGVPPDARDAVFDRFYSERPSGESFGRHSGLGLSIARAIVEALEGEIFVTDRFDSQRGARFVVRLPRL